jgi:crossover junction endodeoxyribonuclease RusA
MTRHDPAEWVIPLPWTGPLLTANQRLHWAARARLTRTVRDTVCQLAMNARIPPMGACEVTLHWAPPDHRRRDADNPLPTLKAAADGVVDAGIVSDDTPAYMTKHMPVIEPPRRPARMWLTIRRRTP